MVDLKQRNERAVVYLCLRHRFYLCFHDFLLDFETLWRCGIIHSFPSQYYKLYNARTTNVNCNSKSNFVDGNHPLDRWSLYHINYFPCLVFTEIFEDTEGLIRIRISKKGRKYKEKGQKDKQWSTKHYT